MMSTTTQTNWTWNEAPFSTKLDPKRFYPGATQDEALSRIHFLVDNQRRLGVLSGPTGCGKSMILEVCAKQLRQQNRQVNIQNLVGVQADEFLWQLGVGLGTNPSIHATPRQLWKLIDDQIKAGRYQRVSNVLMFDDVEDAETDVLTMIARLAQSDPSDDSRLTLVLTCEQSRTHLLGERLRQLCDLLVDVEPWTVEETIDFLRTGLSAAACDPDLFSDGADRRLHELTEGVPRRVQQLAQLSLVAASAEDLEFVDVETLEAVCQEFVDQADEHAWN